MPISADEESPEGLGGVRQVAHPQGTGERCCDWSVMKKSDLVSRASGLHRAKVRLQSLEPA